jgi:hypothetical protein
MLYEEDRGVLLCLLNMAAKNNNKPFDFNLPDIAEEKGVKNRWQKSCLQPIRESIDRLLEARIRIRPVKDKGLTAIFSFIEGWLNFDDTGHLSVSPYIDVVRDLTLGSTYIDMSRYFKVKGQLARSLYVFLESQRPFYNGGEYSIRSSSLMEYINYDPQQKPRWRITQQIKNSCDELLRMGLLEKYDLDQRKFKQDGGLLTFKKVQKKVSTKNTLFEQFWSAYPKQVDKRKALVAWNSLKDSPGIDVLLEAIEAQKGNVRWQNTRFIPNPANWIRDMRWLDDSNEMKAFDLTRTNTRGSRLGKPGTKKYLESKPL